MQAITDDMDMRYIVRTFKLIALPVITESTLQGTNEIMIIPQSGTSKPQGFVLRFSNDDDNGLWQLQSAIARAKAARATRNTMINSAMVASFGSVLFFADSGALA